MLAHPAQFHGAQGPQVVDFIDNLGLVFFRHAHGRIDVHRIGGAGNNHIRRIAVHNRLLIMGNAPDKGEDIPHTGHAVSFIGIPVDPEKAHAVNVLFPVFPAHQVGILPPQMGIRAGHNGDLMASLHPAFRHEEGPEFHAMEIGTGVVVQVYDIHKACSFLFIAEFGRAY